MRRFLNDGIRPGRVIVGTRTEVWKGNGASDNREEFLENQRER